MAEAAEAEAKLGDCCRTLGKEGEEEEEEEENVEQQRTELEMLQSIYSNEIIIVKENTEFLVTVVPQFESEVELILTTTSGNLSVPNTSRDGIQSTGRSTRVTHLPPIELYVKYHSGYPSKLPPNFHISSRWIDPKVVPLILEKLQQLFTPDFPMVFECITYLQQEFVRDYNTYQNTIPHEDHPHRKPNTDEQPFDLDTKHSDGPPLSNHSCQVFLRSTSLLDDMEEFDRYEDHKEFLKNKHECGICVSELLGEEFCEPCGTCKQLFCKNCILGYCQVCIGEGQVGHLQCPYQSCTSPLSDTLLQDILPKELFERYVHLRNEVQLDSVPGMVFCPRTSCGSRVISEPDSNLAVCPQCAFPFCKLCRQTWHGPGICPALEKVGAQRGDEVEVDTVVVKKKNKQDQRRIEELKSLIWMRSGENARPCPKCQSMIQKNGGCNKMTCRSCSSSFCWLCGKLIAGYNHFNSSGCQMFRPEDYLPPQEQGRGREVVEAPNDEQLLQDVLMSECPRCGQVESKTNNRNWIHCRKCHFQYCHLCREACFGAWHFSDYGCKQLTTVTEDLALFTQERRRKRIEGEATVETDNLP